MRPPTTRIAPADGWICTGRTGPIPTTPGLRGRQARQQPGDRSWGQVRVIPGPLGDPQGSGRKGQPKRIDPDWMPDGAVVDERGGVRNARALPTSSRPSTPGLESLLSTMYFPNWFIIR